MPITAPAPPTEPVEMAANPPSQTPLMGLLGAKGGVGTTMLSTSLAWSLSRLGLQVLLVDLNFSGGQAALHLCDQNAGPTWAQVLGAIDRLDATLLETLLTPVAPGLRLLPAPRPNQIEAQTINSTQADQVMSVLELAQSLADVVLLDLPSQPSSAVHSPRILKSLSALSLITQPTMQSTYGARQWLERLNPAWPQGSRQGPTRLELVINPVGKHDAMSPADMARALGFEDPLQVRSLPRSEATVSQALYEGQALADFNERDPLSRRITEWAVELKALWAGEETRAAPTPRPWLRAPLRRWVS